jgi:hypothetical protein
MKLNNRAIRALEVTWNVDPQWITERQAELSFDIRKEKVA